MNSPPTLNNVVATSILFSVGLATALAEENGTELSELHVPSGFTIERAAGADLVDYPMFATFDATGRLFVFESAGNLYETTKEALDDPQFHISLLEDLDGDGIFDKRTLFAENIGFPQGGVFYEGSLYASSAPDLLKLTDTDGDGKADQRETLLSGWVLNVNANSLIGPFLAPDGWFYMTSAIEGFDVTTQEGERLKGETARIWRVKPDGSRLEWISAGGMNNPVELAFTAAGEPIGTETFYNNPHAGLRDAMVYWVYGGVYPKPNSNITRDGLPLTGELLPAVSRYSRIAPAGITRFRSVHLGSDIQGDLFTAEFNTRRVVRHDLKRDKASFTATGEPFLWSDNEDFHPTDVIEDADGSLLVVETGGWFIKGCPLSQVSKPELQGSIYRVRRSGANRPADPYGNDMDWTKISPEALAQLLEDPRPFVVDRAIQEHSTRSNSVVGPLQDLLKSSPNSEARTHATFALSRIDSPDAAAAVRSAFDDPNLDTRIAAARAIGLAKDKEAIARLMEMAVHDQPAARRQAATALGQIGDTNAIPALLSSAGEAEDRFTEHAAIFALITLESPDLLEEALIDSEPKVRKAALIALDQMPSSPLAPNQVMPFLDSEDPELQKAALWVSSHHPDWADGMIEYLEKRLAGHSFLDSEQSSLLRTLLISFSAAPSTQRLIANELENAAEPNQAFLIEVMSSYGGESLPELWVVTLDNLISGPHPPTIKQSAIKLLRSRGTTGQSEVFAKAASEDSNPPMLRIEALSAKLSEAPELNASQFEFLYTQLENARNASLRQEAAAALSEAALSNSQLLELAQDYLPKADAFTLPRLLPVFKGTTNVEVGLALVAALEASDSLSSFTRESIESAFAQVPPSVLPHLTRLLAKLDSAHAQRLERLEFLEGLAKPDTVASVERGRSLFFGKGICYTCHTVGDQGTDFGPDLTAISYDRSTHDLLEAIVYPSVSYVREFETYQIKTANETYVGIIKERNPDFVVIAASPQASARIPTSEIVSSELLNLSLMPQGLDRLMTDEEVGDLLSFLIGQNR